MAASSGGVCGVKRKCGAPSRFESSKSAAPSSTKACTATAFTEYNYLYHLDAPTVLEWVSALKRLGPVGSGFRLPKLRG